VHCRLLVTSAAPIFDDIETYLISVNHETNFADDPATPPDSPRYRSLNSPHIIGIPKEADFTKLELALGQVEQLRVLELRYTSKVMHWNR
jgi:hypothetical protein